MKRAPATLFAAFFHFDVSFMVWVILGPLALFIAKDIPMTDAQKAFLVSIPPLGGAFFRIVVGFLSDRFGAKIVGVCSMGITLLPLLIGWLAPNSYGTMLGVGFLLGIAGASFAVSLPLASRWFPPEKQGLAMGIAGAGNSGTALSTLFAPVLAAKFGWHATLGFAALPVVLALLVFTLLASDSPNHPAPKKLSEYGSLLSQSDTWLFCFFYSITFGGFLALVSYLAIFFNTAYGVDKVKVGVLVAIAAIFGSLLRPIGGSIADRIGGVAVLRVVYAAFAILCLSIALHPPLILCDILVFLTMGTLGMGNGAVFQIVPQRFPKEIGVITGIVGAAGGIGGFYLPNVLGVVRQATGSFTGGFVAIAILGLVGAIAITFVGRQWRGSFLTGGTTSFAFALEEG